MISERNLTIKGFTKIVLHTKNICRALGLYGPAQGFFLVMKIERSANKGEGCQPVSSQIPVTD